ncbi:MAG: nicotinate (nicotinamide) nucleotide adenylyltransferase [Verrucomicrobiales bacterium]
MLPPPGPRDESTESTSQPPRIALFGGSFDPPHAGHLAIARAAVEACGLERVIFVPCRQSPHKKQATEASGEQRLALLELATAGLDWAEVSPLELEREGPSWSWESAEHFAGAHPEAQLFWILGEDQWGALESWAHPEILQRLVNFIVFPREGTQPQPRPGYRADFVTVDHPASSREVRRRLRQSGEASEFLDPEVAHYLEQNGLYRSDS